MSQRIPLLGIIYKGAKTPTKANEFYTSYVTI